MSDHMIIRGTVKKVDKEETQVSASFSKRELVVSTQEQYPQHILINFTQGKCNNQLDQIKPGDNVSVSINIRGREWTNPQGEIKYFNDIQGWMVVVDLSTPAAQTTQAPAANQQQPFQPSSNFNEEEHDNLPF